MVSIQKNIYELREFRKRFGGELSDKHVEEIFGIKSKGTDLKEKKEDEWEIKLGKAQEYVETLRVLDWVKYIAVTGSVAAEVAKEEDDIDVYVVVKNDRLWLYRGLMMINPKLRGLSRRVGNVEVKDSLCLNLISEERGVEFDPDFFNFHELYFMKPIYNPGYKDYILSKNLWVMDFGGKVKKGYLHENGSERRNILLKMVDLFAFYSQFLFMYITKHKPEYKRLLSNNRKGRIEFFMTSFKDEVLRNN